MCSRVARGDKIVKRRAAGGDGHSKLKVKD